ncbi:IPTL-CTERM sorting domain-containing protein [Portibacter lacus]|uniref:IPTL-CTERM protein sorting domain-containing protein n=1 Tax=Portibacter lacus TaxID=1099794 RepID=A0AA37WD00_9BACT|nr:IPTL-CTERM sorting domain-containing protein [Portibacter lacus]GLR17321.1 hypothetical protein GCM10007940_19360 [Portibacter lacus]
MCITKTISRLSSVLILFFISISLSYGSIIFDGSPGTNAPPPTLGGQTMTPFPLDPNANYTSLNQVAVPGSADFITFSQNVSKRTINDGWNSLWSHGYTGDVYFNTTSSLTLTFPAGTSAFYFYAETNQFGSFTMEAIGSDGTSSGPIDVFTSPSVGGSQYFGFYTDSEACEIMTITITTDDTSGFAVGEFGIALNQFSAAVPTMGQWGIIILSILMLIFAIATYKKVIFKLA